MKSKQNSLVEDTYDHILKMIMNKELIPGEKISELKIAEDLGISRSPVRESIRRLANDGLIIIYPNRFAELACFSDEEVKEIGMMRLVMDVAAIKLALLYGSQADFLNLRQIAKECHAALISKDDRNRIRLDCDFHLLLAKIGKNNLLVKFHNELYLRVQFTILHHSSKQADLYTEHINQHLEIAEALIEHNEETAIELIKSHIISFYDLDETYHHKFLDNFVS